MEANSNNTKKLYMLLNSCCKTDSRIIRRMYILDIMCSSQYIIISGDTRITSLFMKYYSPDKLNMLSNEELEESIKIFEILPEYIDLIFTIKSSEDKRGIKGIASPDYYNYESICHTYSQLQFRLQYITQKKCRKDRINSIIRHPFL